MRKTIFVLAFAATILAGCSGASNKKEAVKSDETIVKTLDSLSNEVDKAKKDIENSSKQVDSLINKL